MTVAKLIEILSGLPQDHIVLVDKTGNFNDFPKGAMGEAIVVAKGIGYNTSVENSGSNYWIGAEPWQHEWAGRPLEGVPCVYIGSGTVLKEPVWQKV